MTQRGSKRVTTRTGPKALGGGPRERQRTAIVLEVLSGIRGPQSGAEALGVSMSRYYSIETRALQGMLAALAPRPRGPRTTSPERELESLRRDKARLEQEVARGQSMLRVLERSIGVPKSRTGSRIGGKHGKTKKTRRRTVVRARGVIEALRSGPEPDPQQPAGEDRS